MRSYAAATATTAHYESIREGATSGDADKPAKSTTIPYRNALERLWVLDPVPAWLPSHNSLSELSKPPKHHLADPALAARMLGIDRGALPNGGKEVLQVRGDGNILGALFESLVTLSIRVLAQTCEASVKHLRAKNGTKEVDLIVQQSDQRILAIEVKLSQAIQQDDVKHLLWLKEKLGDDLLDAVVVSSGPEAYRRQDGIGVIPAVLLGL